MPRSVSERTLATVSCSNPFRKLSAIFGVLDISAWVLLYARDHPRPVQHTRGQPMLRRRFYVPSAIVSYGLDAHQMTPRPVQQEWGSNWTHAQVDPNRPQCFVLEPTAEVTSSRFLGTFDLHCIDLLVFD